MVNRTIWANISRLFPVDTCLFCLAGGLLGERTLFLVLPSLLYSSCWEAGSLLYYSMYPIPPHPLEARRRKGGWTRLSWSDPLTQDFEGRAGRSCTKMVQPSRSSGHVGVCIQWWQNCAVALVTMLIPGHFPSLPSVTSIPFSDPDPVASAVDSLSSSSSKSVELQLT